MKTVTGGMFPREIRETKSMKALINTPGPGYYKVLSEFGDIDFPPVLKRVDPPRNDNVKNSNENKV